MNSPPHAHKRGFAQILREECHTCRLFFTIFLLILFSAFQTGMFIAEEKLSIVSTSFPPLSTPEQDGYVDLIVKEACSRIGIRAEIVHLPAERSLSNANQGIDDGDLLRIGGMETRYPNLVPVEEPLVEFEFVAFSKDNSFTPNGWESLKPFSVGIITGWKILEENVTESSHLTKTRDSSGLFRMLENDHIDVAVYNRIEGEWLIRKLGCNSIKALSPPFATRNMFLYLHKKHRPIADRLEAEFKAMKAEGLFDQIRTSTLLRLAAKDSK